MVGPGREGTRPGPPSPGRAIRERALEFSWRPSQVGLTLSAPGCLFRHCCFQKGGPDQVALSPEPRGNSGQQCTGICSLLAWP